MSSSVIRAPRKLSDFAWARRIARREAPRVGDLGERLSPKALADEILARKSSAPKPRGVKIRAAAEARRRRWWARVGVWAAGLIALTAIALLAGCSDSSDSLGAPRLTFEEAEEALIGKLDDVRWSEEIVSGVSTSEAPARDLAETLPDIDVFPIVAAPERSSAAVAEIFVSTEKSGTGDDGWMREAAEAFNASGARTPSGAQAGVRIRKIASGTGYQFIGSGKHRPHAFSPSNKLWIEMAGSHGVTMTPIAERTVGNIAGVVMKSEVADRLRADGRMSVPGIIDAVVLGDLVAGYTDPFASSTGLNFLVTVLASFSGGDAGALLSPAASSAFETFQASVPFIALTTLQMRESVRRDGSLDAFVMEWQTYANTAELSAGYEFTPFGWPHDNPLYAVGDIGDERMASLRLFAEFLASREQQNRATEMGFNPSFEHAAPTELPDGATLRRAQALWKEKKDAGRPIAAVFVADASGSMDGSRIRQLQRALLDGSGFIAPTNAIGLVEFSADTRVVLPIKPFTVLHQAAFQTAVKRMSAGGGTAMYDAIAVGLKMLVEYRRDNPDVRPMLFALTDGETNQGMAYHDMSDVIAGLKVPVVTVGFEADLDELSRLSATVEAASIQAAEGDVRHKLGMLFNSQM